MIVWQISLSGHALRTLVSIREGRPHDQDMRTVPDHFVSWVRSLRREGLVSYEQVCDCDEKPSWWRRNMLPEDERWKVGAHWHTKGRKSIWEITPKGELALQLAAHDIEDFLEEVKQELVPLVKGRKRIA